MSGLSTRKRPRSVHPVTAGKLLDRQRQQQQQQGQPPSARFTGAALLQHPQWKLVPGTLTELAGPAGVGKTQLALTLCADSVLLQEQAVYISLGSSSSGREWGRVAHRLECMLQARLASSTTISSHSAASTSATKTAVKTLLRDVLLQSVRNTEDLKDVLQTSLPRLLQQSCNKYKKRRIRLVVLDGIASLFRHAEHGTSTLLTTPQGFWQERAAAMFQVATICKKLAEEHQVPFVIINQATTRIIGLNNKNETSGKGASSSSRLEPALGLAWKQCVNASWFVSNTDSLVRLGSSISNNNTTSTAGSCRHSTARKRKIVSLKSPRLSCQATMEFYIDARGTVRLNNPTNNGGNPVPNNDAD